MTSEGVVEIMRQMLMAAFWLAAPLLAIGFIVAFCLALGARNVANREYVLEQ